MGSPLEKLAEGPSMDHADPPAKGPSASLALDTTAGSILHRLAGYHLPVRPKFPSVTVIYLAAVAATYVPLLLAAWLRPLPIAALTQAFRLPFLYDWNVAFMFV